MLVEMPLESSTGEPLKDQGSLAGDLAHQLRLLRERRVLVTRLILQLERYANAAPVALPTKAHRGRKGRSLPVAS